MKLLVVGNGSIGTKKKSKFYINNRTGYFLQNIKGNLSTIYADTLTYYDKNSNIQNFDLVSNHINFKALPKKRNPAFIPELIKLIKQNDFLYLFYPGSLSKITALIAIFLNKPFGIYIRGQYYNQNVLDRIILKKTQFFITISPPFVDDLLRFTPNVDIIKPMIEIDVKDFKYHRNYISKKKLNLLFVGRVEERKGMYELIEIAKYLRNSGLLFELNIVGGGDLFDTLKAKINELGMDQTVIFHGLITNKKKLMSFYEEASAFIFTSHDEGFPRVLYEAMATALPIFTTFVGGISGRMKDKWNCIEIPVQNPNKASVLIIKYLQDETTLEKIGKNGQDTLKKILNGSLYTHEELLLKYIQRKNKKRN